MDKISKALSDGKSHKPLRGLVGDDRVSDVIYKINRLVEQCETVGLVSAGSSWAAMADHKNPEKDLPLGTSSAKKHSVLLAQRLKLEKHLQDRSMIDSEARRNHASDHFLPPFMTMMAADLVLDTASFSCAFDKFVSSQFQQNEFAIKSFRDSLERFLNLNPEKYSVLQTYELLVVVRDRMSQVVTTALNRGNDQSKMMSKAQKHSQPQPPQVSVSQLMEAIKQANQQSSGGEKRKAKGKHEDEAMGAFTHNGNQPQDKAASVAAANQAGKKRVKLESIPEDPAMRTNTIKDTVCKFFWTPSLGCSRDNCRFAHVSQAETRAMGISDEEVAGALK